jgi:hypothetical protein
MIHVSKSRTCYINMWGVSSQVSSEGHVISPINLLQAAFQGEELILFCSARFVTTFYEEAQYRFQADDRRGIFKKLNSWKVEDFEHRKTYMCFKEEVS